MNRSKIEWCDHTWNPITGCRHNCEYCYARSMVARFAGDIRLNKMARDDYSLLPAADGSGDMYVLDKPMLNETGNQLVYPFGFAPTLHKYRMDDTCVPAKLKMGSNIFVGAMSDIFGDWVPCRWIDDIFSICMQYKLHNYLFLTKNPDRYEDFGVPKGQANLWYGTTITCDADIGRIVSLIMNAKTFVSIEPLRGQIGKGNIEDICGIADWIIIGAETGRNKNKVIPEAGWVEDIVAEADKTKVPVFMKDSLIDIVGESNMRRDFPEQLLHTAVSPKMEKKLYGICAECKDHLKKSDMITLLARSRRGEQPKQFGFMCRECFKKLCLGLGLDIPELAELADSVTIGSGGIDG